jgi:hypothetical protein
MSNDESYKRHDAWKKLNDWSHNVNDDDLNELFSEYEDDGLLLDLDDEISLLVSFFRFVFGFVIVFGFFSVALWQLISTVIGITEFTLFKAFISSVCVGAIRYTDAGIMKQMNR